jgi:hypothetical protein
MAFLFKLETVDGQAGEPAELHAAVPNWRAGDTIPQGDARCESWPCERWTATSRPSWWLRRWTSPLPFYAALARRLGQPGERCRTPRST